MRSFSSFSQPPLEPRESPKDQREEQKKGRNSLF